MYRLVKVDNKEELINKSVQYIKNKCQSDLEMNDHWKFISDDGNVIKFSIFKYEHTFNREIFGKMVVVYQSAREYLRSLKVGYMVEANHYGYEKGVITKINRSRKNPELITSIEIEKRRKIKTDYVLFGDMKLGDIFFDFSLRKIGWEEDNYELQEINNFVKIYDTLYLKK